MFATMSQLTPCPRVTDCFDLQPSRRWRGRAHRTCAERLRSPDGSLLRPANLVSGFSMCSDRIESMPESFRRRSRPWLSDFHFADAGTPAPIWAFLRSSPGRLNSFVSQLSMGGILAAFGEFSTGNDGGIASRRAESAVSSLAGVTVASIPSQPLRSSIQVWF